MGRQTCISAEAVQQAMQLRDQATTVTEYRAALSVILRDVIGLDADLTSEVLGTSRRTVFRDQNRICNQGDAPRGQWGGRRHCSMSVDEEAEFLGEWEAKAAAGGVLSVSPIHAALVERLGRNCPISRTYRLLARHGWRKVQPDTKHPKSDPVAQDEFKKNFPKRWLPPA